MRFSLHIAIAACTTVVCFTGCGGGSHEETPPADSTAAATDTLAVQPDTAAALPADTTLAMEADSAAADSVIADAPIGGAYTLTAAMPADGQKLSNEEKGNAAMAASRLVNNCTLTLEASGSFTHAFPAPNGVMKTVTGQWEKNEEETVLKLHFEEWGEMTETVYKVRQKEGKKLFLETDLGDIRMTYVYSK